MEARPIVGQAIDETAAPRSTRLDIRIVVSPFVALLGIVLSSQQALHLLSPSSETTVPRFWCCAISVDARQRRRRHGMNGTSAEQEYRLVRACLSLLSGSVGD
jgi:hypothetical protein